jgi:hypothetical protein
MGSPIGQFPGETVAHCVERLIDRYGFSSSAKASTAYLTHHAQLVRGEGELLYTRDGSLVFRLESGGRYFYPVRAFSHSAERIITITYLDPEMILKNIISLYVLENADEHHRMQKRDKS